MSEPVPTPPQPELTERQRKITEQLNQGDLLGAREGLEEMIVAESPVDGPYHPRLVSARLLLARLNALMGEPAKSEAVLAPLQAIPEDDPTRASVFLNAQILVSAICRSQGRLEEAFSLSGAALDQLDKLAGDPVNPDSFRALVHMIEIAREGQQLQQALDLCVKGIERFQDKVGEAHAHMILLAGSVFLAAEEYDKAREHFEGIMAQLQAQDGMEHELAARAHFFLAQLERDQDNDEKALEHLEACLQILSKGGDPELVVESQQQVLQLRLSEMPAAEGENALAGLLELAARVHGPRSTKAAEVLGSMGYEHRRQGDTLKARGCYETALGIWRSWRHPEDAKIAFLEKTLVELGD